ncbi:MAG: TfoX/Sxy family protein [Myxococcales bacterium]|nr:TfoX/Sxy family protein [Myxococcales bacterium]
MSYDEALAERVRRALAGIDGLTEKKMFGGVAFLVEGAMCIGVHERDLIVRCEKAETDALLAQQGVRPFDLSGARPMKGWLLVGPEATATAAGLKPWVDAARGRALQPRKPGKKAASGGSGSSRLLRAIAPTLDVGSNRAGGRRSMTTPEELFWQLAADLQREDPRVREGTLMNGRCLRVGKEFLALLDYKGSGLVVKLPAERVAALIEGGVGRPFGPAGKVFAEWLSVPEPDRQRWWTLLREGVAFVGR